MRFRATVDHTVLIVEDDHATRHLLEALLRHESLDCEMACDGNAAMRLLASRRYAAVLLDLLLPNVNGFELLRHLKNTDPGLLKRVLVITAASASTYQGCAELRDVCCLLRKPLDIQELMSEIRRCIAGSPPAPQEKWQESVR